MVLLSRITNIAIATLLTAALIATPTFAAEPAMPTVSEVMKKMDDLYRSSASHATLSMAITTRRFKRTLTIESWSRGEEKALMVVRKPAREAGSASLKSGEGLWSYAPRADRLIRIPSGMLSDSWMGSHFTTDDLMQESSWDRDYTSTIERITEGGVSLYKVVSIPKPDSPIVYTKVVQTMTVAGLLPVKVLFYDGDDIVRTMDYSKVKTLDGRNIPTVMTVTPADKPGESTVVTYEAMDFDADVPERMFSPSGLKRAAQSR